MKMSFNNADKSSLFVMWPNSCQRETAPLLTRSSERITNENRITELIRYRDLAPLKFNEEHIKHVLTCTEDRYENQLQVEEELLSSCKYYTMPDEKSFYGVKKPP